MALVDTRLRRLALATLIVGLAVLPRVASPFVLELVTQTALAAVGALALNVLAGLAGRISLGHAGFLCAGAFTVGSLAESVKAPPLVTLPAAAVVGGLLGLVVGVPSLRLKGLYLALGTLAMHFVVLYVASEYQARWGFNTGVSVPAPTVAGVRFRSGVQWYYVLVAFAMLTTFLSVNLGRSRVGRAWMAIHDREIAAASLGIAVARYKLLAFVASSVLTALAGALWAYYRSFVSVEAFSFVVTIEFIAMIVIGGMGSTLGALLGAGFVTLLPYGIDAVVGALAPGGAAPYWLFPLKFGAFGLLMALFLVFEPLGLVGIWLPSRLVRRGLVRVPERENGFETLTGVENLQACRRGGDLEAVFTHFPGLADRRRQLAGYLSGGERQMLALGSALLCQPRLLLVDELSLGLAPIVVRALMEAVRRLRDELGLTILLVEQNAAAALEIADHGYVIENGRIVHEGSAAALLAHDDVREFYLGGARSRAGRTYRDVKQYRRHRRWFA